MNFEQFKKYLTIENVFPIFVVVASIIAIFRQLNYFFVPALLLSCLGILGAFLFFKGNKYFKYCINIWLLGQLLIIDKTFLDQQTGITVTIPIWDLSQGFSFKFGFKFIQAQVTYNYNINLAIILVWLLVETIEKKFFSKKLIGKYLVFNAFRQHTAFADLFPLIGTITENVTVAGDVSWLLVKLENDITYQTLIFNHVLIKSKEDTTLNLSKGKQLIYFHLVPNGQKVATNTNNKIGLFPMEDWVYCEVIK